MGIDIYMGGYEAFRERSADDRAAFENAVQIRDGYPIGSREANVAQAYEAIWSGRYGYLRSSYNNAGLFNVLDTLFGIDSAELLFPGDWDAQGDDLLPVDWDLFLPAVQRMKALAACLKHGDPLPVCLEELATGNNDARKRAEAFGASVCSMVMALGGDGVEAGNDHQHGFYNEDDYGWYTHEGLNELEAFGQLGKQTNEGVYISF